MYQLAVIIGGVCVVAIIKCVKMRIDIRKKCNNTVDLEAPLVDLTDYSSI